MTKPRAWPNDAKEARDRSAEEAANIVNNLEPLIEDHDLMPEAEKLRRAARSLNSAQKILRMLEKLGAPTRVR